MYPIVLDDIRKAMIAKDADLYWRVANMLIPDGADVWRKMYPEDFPDMLKPIASEPVEYWVKPRQDVE